MTHNLSAGSEELARFLDAASEIQTLEVMTVDLNGILRGKRIPRGEFETLFSAGVNACGSTPLVNTQGDIPESINFGSRDGDPDKIVRPVPDTVVVVPWLTSPTGQALASYWNQDGTPGDWDPRHVLRLAAAPLAALGLTPVIATELEFYLLEANDTDTPRPKFGTVPGTGLRQEGTQYAMLEDLWDHDGFLDDVRRTCEIQGIPATTAHSEFSPGQLEINLHHVNDPVLAADHAVLLKRLVKGVARQHHTGATFMAKPFAEFNGSGLHIHISLYDENGDNVFAQTGNVIDEPPLTDKMRHAAGGLAVTMEESMAIFAPNANSYRRLVPGAYAPLTPNWGYNHRNVSLRIPVSDPNNLRIEHRVAGADANPYLVIAAVLAGIHHGISNKIDPGRLIQAGELLDDIEPTLPRRWDEALNKFDDGTVFDKYFGAEYLRLFSAVRRDECETFNSLVTNRDYEWYLRAL